ncbi:MAG: ATP-binding protein [Verrucomicrobiia bacterium]
MRAALALTNSVDTQRLLTEIAGPDMHFITVALPPGETSAASVSGLLAKWLRLVDAVIVDAASLGEASRPTLETLLATPLPEHSAVVVRTAVHQPGLPALPPEWLIVSDTDTPEQLKQSLHTFFRMHKLQTQLKRANALLDGERPPTQGVGASPSTSPSDSFRYREALKSISRIVGQQHEEKELLAEYVRLVSELLGVARLAILLRRFEADLFHQEPTLSGNELIVAASKAMPPEVVEHLRLTLTGGIGAYVATEAKILRRGQRMAVTAGTSLLDLEEQMAREFEWLGTEVVVPILDNGQLLGLLTFNGRVTGEALSNEELELVYHLMTQLAQALRSRRLAGQVTSQQQFIGEVVANVQSGVVVVGQDGRVLCVNNRARQLFGLGAQEKSIVGHRVNRLPSRVADVFFEVLETGREVSQREVMLPRENRPLAVSAKRFTPSGAAAATGQIVVGMIEDLTRVRLRESQQRVLTERELFSRVAARLSHELRNALVPIKIFAQLLPERYSEAEFRNQFSQSVIHEVDRIDSLMSKLTFFAHPLQLVREEIDLGELIGAVLMDVALECARRHTANFVYAGAKTAPAAQNNLPVVTVKTSFAHKAVRLEADRIRLMQGFQEVVYNSIQSMPKGGRLLISTRDAEATDFPNAQLPEGGAVRIEWQDTGEGISLDNLKRVVEPFVTTRNVGVGLGLTVVKKIVEHHGGFLEIDSTFGKGAVVAMILPVKAQQLCGETGLRDEANGDASEKLADEGEMGGPEKVLDPELGAEAEDL